MRPVILSILGAFFIYPSLRRTTPGTVPVQSRLLRFTRGLATMNKEFIGIAKGSNYHKPSAASLLFSTLNIFGILWLTGSDLMFASIIGIAGTLLILFRWSQIAKGRRDELASFWPGYLDQVRAKMLTSSRALSYVFYDESFAGSAFLRELLDQGKREFENSGDLEKSFLTIWRFANNETTNYVCSSLWEVLGGTSSQIEQQLMLISSVLRSRNALEHEANSRLAGVRTARAFIVIIPVGMALAGISFAGATAPFLTKPAILQILIALAILAMCWYWSSRLMSFPRTPTHGCPTDQVHIEAAT